jgi:hypothetical protein
MRVRKNLSIFADGFAEVVEAAGFGDVGVGAHLVAAQNVLLGPGCGPENAAG